MTTLNPASNGSVADSGQLFFAPVTEAPRSQVDQLVALARDVNANPIARGEAMARLDIVTGGRAETLLAQAGDATQLASAARTGGIQSDTRIGDPLWGTRVAGMAGQLQREAQLQRGVDRNYADALAADARDFNNGTARIAQGSYSVAIPRERVTTESRNPLFVDALSQRNGELTIRSLTQRINANSAELQRLVTESAALAAERGVRGVVLSDDHPIMRDLTRRIERNSERIVQLGADTVQATAERNKALNDTRLQGSRAENGNMYRAVANGADASRPPVIFINGVNTDVNRSALQAMELSAQFRAPVDHVVNVSSMDKMITVGVDVLQNNPSGRLPDLNVTDQRLQQLMSGNRPAAATAANAILDQLLNGNEKVKIVGYSQGAAIGNEALRMVNDYLANVQGMSEAQRSQMLSRVEFLGIGPAAGERHIARTFTGDQRNPGVRDIPALQSVDYRTIYDRRDPITQLMNVSNPDGSRTNTTDIGRALRGAAQFVSPGGILPHLSYFRSYEATDPGSVYNPAMSDALHRWYAGAETPRNTILDASRPGGR
jgi:hypothetical protein